MLNDEYITEENEKYKVEGRDKEGEKEEKDPKKTKDQNEE
jgi:hypothetical protein